MSNDLTNALNSLIDQMNHHLSSGEINNPGVQDSLNNVVIPDSHSSGLVEQFPISGVDSTDIFHHPQSDYSLPDSANPHYQQHEYYQSEGYGDSFTYSHACSFCSLCAKLGLASDRVSIHSRVQIF